MKYIAYIALVLTLPVSLVSCTKLTSSQIKVKGLYYGMTDEEACKVLTQQFPDPIPTSEVGPFGDGSRVFKNNDAKYRVIKGDDGYTIAYCSSDFLNLQDQSVLESNPAYIGFITKFIKYYPDVESDKNHKVTQILFSQKLSDKIFNADQLNSKEFVQQFMDAYGISEFKADNNGNYHGWKYHDPSGYDICIAKDHGILIQETQKTNFN